jgi:hypothetical protein
VLGKLESGDSSELPKVDNVVAERLQNDLSNLDAENEKLRADYAALLESSTVVTNKLREELKVLSPTARGRRFVQMVFVPDCSAISVPALANIG